MKIIIALFIIFSVVYSQQVQICDLDPKLVKCSSVKEPVCGIKYKPNGKQDKQTYDNYCQACAIGLSVFTVQGKCEDYPCSAQFCSPLKTKRLCLDVNNPVCGYFNNSVKCVAAPCAVDATNSCVACNNSNVLYYLKGTCPKPKVDKTKKKEDDKGNGDD